MPPRPGFGPSVLILIAVVAAAFVVALALPPIPQDPAYHGFADRRHLLGVPNGLNVLSNIGFVIVGVLGLAFVSAHRRPRNDEPMTNSWEVAAYGGLFAAVGLTGLGSAWYHLAPTNASLVWDRLPLAVSATTLFAIVLAERVSLRAAWWLWPFLVAFGLASVLVWWRGEQGGAGDLRLYGLAQFTPLVTIPLMMALFPPRYTAASYLIGALGWYAVAKLCEHFDAQIFALGHVVSGHTLKHIAAALAGWWILLMLKRRQPTFG